MIWHGYAAGLHCPFVMACPSSSRSPSPRPRRAGARRCATTGSSRRRHSAPRRYRGGEPANLRESGERSSCASGPYGAGVKRRRGMPRRSSRLCSIFTGTTAAYRVRGASTICSLRLQQLARTLQRNPHTILCMSELLERLRNHKEEQQRQWDIEVAWNVLRPNFDGTKPRRFVSGVCVSSGEKNSNGVAFRARGVSATLPIPLLWNHLWLRPIGKVIGIETRADQVHFRAELANSGCLQWAEDVWAGVICQGVVGVSVEGRNLAPSITNGTFIDWRIAEISLTEAGADSNAQLYRVWGKEPCVRLDRPSEYVFWGAWC